MQEHCTWRLGSLLIINIKTRKRRTMRLTAILIIRLSTIAHTTPVIRVKTITILMQLIILREEIILIEIFVTRHHLWIRHSMLDICLSVLRSKSIYSSQCLNLRMTRRKILWLSGFKENALLVLECGWSMGHGTLLSTWQAGLHSMSLRIIILGIAMQQWSI